MTSRDNIIKLAKETDIYCWHRTWDNDDWNRLEAFFHAARKLECAKVCDELGSTFKGHSSKRPWAGDFAYAIRNRSAT